MLGSTNIQRRNYHDNRNGVLDLHVDLVGFRGLVGMAQPSTARPQRAAVVPFVSAGLGHVWISVEGLNVNEKIEIASDDDRVYFASGLEFQNRQKLLIKTAHYDPAIMLGDGTWIPARPPHADSTWVITPTGWLPPPTLDEFVAMLPVPFWRRILSRIICWASRWFYNLRLLMRRLRR